MNGTFLALFLALAIERFGGERHRWRRPEPLQRYLRAVARLLGPWPLWQGPLGVAALLLPGLALVQLGYGLLSGWFLGLAGLALAVAMLLYSLGPRPVERVLQDYLDSTDEAGRARHFHDLAGGEPMPLREPERAARLAELAFVAANRRRFAVLFWFVLGGPLAALAYRLSRELDEAGPALAPGLQQAARIWLGLLDWAPARLLVFTLALTGPFERLWPLLRAGLWCPPARCPERNAELLRRAGRACLPDTDAEGGLAQVGGVLRRVLVVWVVVLAALAVLGGAVR